MRNTIRNVTMVVPVLMTSCHVSDQPKKGPEIAQMRTTATAITNVIGDPTCCSIQRANRSNLPTVLSDIAVSKTQLSRPPANGRWNGLFAWDEGCGGKHGGKIGAQGCCRGTRTPWAPCQNRTGEPTR